MAVMTEKATQKEVESASSQISIPDLEQPSVDLVAEQRVIRKIDQHIIPVVILLYLFSFLDRVNIGNARLFGLEKDLGLKGNQFQIVVLMLFVTYILSEVPSNLILKKAKPSRWIAFIATSWGLVATFTGLTQNFTGMVICRLFLGLFEGGLFPGLAIYLTFFYTKRELALRIGYLFVCAALSGSLGGLLAFVVGYMDGVAGLRGWRWIFILEGIPTVIIGIASWWLLPDDPASARFLSAEEKELITARLERQTGFSKSSQQFSIIDALKAIKDWKVLIFCLAQFGSGTMLYGYSTFLPTIIKSMGHWSVPQIQALTIPCYALGAITYLVVAKFSDRQQRRGVYVLAFGSVSIVGYGVLLSKSSSGVHYLGCLLVAMGLYVVLGIPLSWLPTNLPRYGKRTTATGLQLAISNFAGILVPFLYLPHDGPRYVTGHAVTLALLAFSTGCATFMSWYFSRVNAGRLEGKEDWKQEGKTEEETAEMGDDSPRFMYTV